MRWFFGILALLAVALILETGLLAYAMYVLLGVAVVSRFLARSWIDNLSAVREWNRTTAEIGDTVAVNVTIHNHGWLPVPWVLLEDLLPESVVGSTNPRIRVKGKRLQISMIRPHGSITLRYQLQIKTRGYHQVGPLVLESGDLFGLHRRYRVATEPQFLLVYPRVVALEGYDLTSRRPIGDVLMTHRLYEDPTRIAGVREYQFGDPLNRVHWRATARTGQLHCKLYEPSTVAGATILLDLHEAGYPRQGEPFRSELAVTTAVSLANSIALMGQQVGLITNGRDAADRVRKEKRAARHGLGSIQDFVSRQAAMSAARMEETSDRLEPLIVPTRRGVEQFERIREVLARVELTDGLTLPMLLQESTSRLPRDATVVAVLGHVPIESAMTLGNLRRRGYAVTVVLVMVEEQELEKGMGRLAAEGILDLRHIPNEQMLPGLCQQHAQRATPYLLALTY